MKIDFNITIVGFLFVILQKQDTNQIKIDAVPNIYNTGHQALSSEIPVNQIESDVSSDFDSDSVLSADQVMKMAKKQARKENKNIFIIFYASWCSPCKQMVKAMDDSSCKKYFDNNYVIYHLRIFEKYSSRKIYRDDPGALEMFGKYRCGDTTLGIPFWLIFDKKGNLLADSQIRPKGYPLSVRGENVGKPARPKEVAHFLEVLRKTSKITKEEEKRIYDKFIFKPKSM